ncbi:hypothetical protein KBB92_01260 [Candidatus Shapirobacteria bacterium]|nr:hypothetical protein [Candidatus Shapirobacteria bacterium]HQI13518.1 hypothetical protein [Candidatus Woesebacteria bacterium]
MKKETVERVINSMSGGNVHLRIILQESYKVCQKEIELWPEWRVPRLISGLQKTADYLINNHFGTENFRTDFAKIINKGNNYWDLPEGRGADMVFVRYLQDKLIYKNKCQKK